MKRLLVPLRVILLGALGMGLVLLGWHLYIDHQNLHTLVRMVQQAQQQAPASH